MKLLKYMTHYFHPLLLVICFLCSSVHLVRAEVVLTPAEQDWLQDHQVVRAHVLDVPPYQFWQNGQARGISVDLLNHIAATIGFQVEYVPDMSWVDAVANIGKHEQVDLLLTARHTLERETFLVFSEEYLKLPWVIFTRSDETGIFGLEDLSGKTIAIEEGYLVQQYLSEKFPQITQKFFPGALEALAAVSKNQVDAYIGNLTVAQYYITQRGLSNVKVAAPTDLDSYSFAFAMRDDWSPLASILTKGLAEITPAARSLINRQYFALTIEHGINVRQVVFWIVGMLVVLGFVFVIILRGNQRLKQEVMERKQAESRSQSILDAISEIGEGLLIIGTDYQIQYMNQIMIDWFGDQTGKICHRSLAGLEQPCSYCQLESVIQEKKTVNYKPTVADGRTFDIVATPISNNDGTTSKMEVLRDITGEMQGQQELEESRQELSLAMEAANLGSWDWRPQSDELFTNDIFLTMLGYEPDAFPLTLERWSTLVQPDDLEQVVTILQPFLDGDDGMYRSEYRMLAADGQWRWILDVGQVVSRDSQGKALRFIGIHIDITESKEADEQLRKLSRAVEQSHSTIVITDLKANIEFVNPAFTRTTGYTLEEALGQNPRVLKSDSQPESFYQTMWDTLTAGKVWQGEMHNKRKDGSLYWEFATISPVKDDTGQTTHYVAIKEDITLRKETEQKLVEAQQQAEAASLAKSSFLANMSHEIRTPMNGIIGMTRLALDTDLNPEQQRLLGNVKISADSLLGLLNDILDFSKIEAGQLVLEEYDFNLSGTLENIISMMGFAAEEKGLGLQLENKIAAESLWVKGDELRVRQILVNLIGNGLKFTENGSVTLRVLLDESGDDQLGLHFMVIDTGIGISEDQQGAIFSQFSQADSATTRKFGGTGLGLTICRQLVEMMGGEIGLESIEGQGSTFYFTLVLPQGTEVEPPVQDDLDVKVTGLNILLVDDNSINCDLACMVLEQDDHWVVIAENGLEALGKVVSQSFDLILMDVQMPIMDGLTASAIIRAAEQGGDLSRFDLTTSLALELINHCHGQYLPIVAMTANAMSGDREKCLAAGMDHYLTKPFAPVQLREIIVDISKIISS